MKNFIFSLCAFFLFLSVKAQNDTLISLDSFEVIAVTPSENYTFQTIDSSGMSEYEFSNLDQLLEQKTDVFIKDYGSGGLSTLSLRGMGSSHTSVFWNGISLNSSMNGTIDLSLLGTNSIDELEVHYGASSMIDGAGSLGGSISLIQTEKFQNQNEYFLSQSIGSFETYQTNASALFSSKKIYFSINAKVANSVNNFNYRNPEKADVPEEVMTNAGYKAHNISVSGGWLVNKSNVLKINLLNISANRNLPKLNTQNEVGENQFDNQHVVSMDWRNYNKWLVNELKVGVKNAELIYTNRNINLESMSHENTFFLQNRTKYTLLKKIKARSIIFFDHVNATNEKLGTTKQLNQIKMTHDFSFALNKKTTTGVLLQTIVSNQGTLPLLPSVNFGVEFFPLLNVSINASYHGALPTINDLYWGEGGNPNLLPESGVSSELNIKGHKKMNKTELSYRGSVFYSEIDNWILWLPDDIGVWRVNNETHVTTYGCEVNANIIRHWSNFKAIVNSRFNYNKALNNKFNQLPYTPEYQIQGGLSLAYKGITINYNQQYIGKRYINANNTSWMPSYSKANARIAYTFTQIKKANISLIAQVYNLYNVSYQSIANRPTTGRSFMFTLKLGIKH